MNDDKIYCPKCGKEQPFMRVDKHVQIFELSMNDTEKIYVIQCKKCGYPVSAYPQQIYPDTDE